MAVVDSDLTITNASWLMLMARVPRERRQRVYDQMVKGNDRLVDGYAHEVARALLGDNEATERAKQTAQSMESWVDQKRTIRGRSSKRHYNRR